MDTRLLATADPKRLGESFKLVSDRLEQVHRGLGEMQSLAAGVGDLKRVLSNVKTRGTWGEVQLAALLEQLLTADQFAANVATRPDSGERVDLASLRLASGVEPAEGYTKVGGAYVSTAIANIRSAPGTDSTVLGRLLAGQRVWVPAAVKGQPWVLVSDQGLGQGYVSAPLLKKAVSGTAANGCRLVKQTISQPGAAEETETLQACRSANGEWTMTRA